MIRILMLAEAESANTINWMNSLIRYGEAEVVLWSLPRASTLIRLLYLPFGILSVRRKIKRYQPHLVIGYRTTSYGFIGAMSGFGPLVIAAQGESDVWPPGHWTNFMVSAMAKHAIRKSALIHAWGKNMVPSLRLLGASDTKLLILPRGIDVTRFPYKEPFEKDNQLKLIVSRSLYPEYNHAIILEAFARVVKRLNVVRCELLIAGHGPLLPSLEQITNDLEIRDNTTFLGMIPPETLSMHLQDSDVYISLPETEGISASLLEAMASGCFPIVTDLPANQEFITHERNGKLVTIQVDEVEHSIIEVWNSRNVWKEITLENRRLVELRADTRINSAKFVAAYKALL